MHRDTSALSFADAMVGEKGRNASLERIGELVDWGQVAAVVLRRTQSLARIASAASGVRRRRQAPVVCSYDEVSSLRRGGREVRRCSAGLHLAPGAAQDAVDGPPVRH